MTVGRTALESVRSGEDSFAAAEKPNWPEPPCRTYPEWVRSMDSPSRMDSLAGCRWRGRWVPSRALAVVGTLLLSCVIAAAAYTLQAELPVLVWGGFVPRRWHALGILLALGGGSLIAGVLSRPPPPSTRRRPGSQRLVLAAAAFAALLATAAVASTVAVAVADGISRYHVLEPTSPGGCRVVVEERSALLLGSGTVYLLPRGSRRAREANSYLADDGYRPVTFGTYSLRWRGEIAHLEILGTTEQPVSYDPKPLTC